MARVHETRRELRWEGGWGGDREIVLVAEHHPYGWDPWELNPSDDIENPVAKFWMSLPDDEGDEHPFRLVVFPDLTAEQRYRWDYGGVPHRVPTWEYSGALVYGDSSWTITELTVRGHVDESDRAASVTTKVLRDVRLGLVYDALAALAQGLPGDPRFTIEDLASFLAPTARRRLTDIEERQLRPQHRRPGRPRRTDAWYINFVRTALRLSGSHDALSVAFDVPVGTVRTWLKAARREGWLAPGHPGRRAIAPGPRYLEEQRRYQ